MKRVLVTGGAGFIGSHLTEALVKRGYSVRVLDNFFSGRQENLETVVDCIELIKGDIRCANTCLKATHGVDTVFHQAALRSVPRSLINPQEYNEVNIQGTLNLLKASVKNKIKVFIFASSSSVYGDSKIFPQQEVLLPQPISPYALTKLTAEHYCRIFSSCYGLRTVSLRYFNVFGPRQALDDEYAVVIPKFISCILKDESPPIYGTGRQSRDFTFVANVVSANLLAAKKRETRSAVYNVAGGEGHSVLELVRMLNYLIGKDIKPVFLPKRAADVFKTHADLKRVKKELGFRPEISFIDGLESTIEYFRKYA